MSMMKSNYNNKAMLAEQALRHTNDMDSLYEQEILDCISNSIIYTDTVPNKSTKIPTIPTVSLQQTDTVSAIFNNHKDNKKIACLNFASYKEPGGKFLDGSSAQEECLCHASYLFNILDDMKEYYEYNKKRLNNALYTNRAIYSPNVRFFSNDKNVLCDVITCASPNLLSAYKNKTIGSITANNSVALKDRINFIKDIAEVNEVDVLILGAFGCGVFKQDPYEVALFFKDIFNRTTIEHIVYAIIPGRNYDVFKSVIM